MKKTSLLVLLFVALSAAPSVADNNPCSSNFDFSAECIEYTREKAEQGVARAQDKIGFMYYNGIKVERDYGEAFRWYRAAAEQGHAEAQNNIGWMYYKGEGVERDYGETLRWYRLAAAQGFAEAQFELGLMYGKGEGVVEDGRESYIWLSIAKAGGHKNAGKSLQEIPFQLTPEEIKSAKREAARRFAEIEKRKNASLKNGE